jgi:RND family efflux transporter MFP subunit
MPGPHRHLVTVAVLVASAFTTPAVSGCGGKPAPSAPQVTAPRAAGTPAGAVSRLVDAAPVRFAPRTVAAGTLKARQQAPLALGIAGTLTRIAVIRGQWVAQGSVLATLEDDAARANLAVAQAALDAARAQATQAEDGLARVTSIHQQEGTTDSALIQARAGRDLAMAQVAGAEARLALARVNLSHHTLTAPFAGLVTHVPDGIGLSVAAGQSLVTLVETRLLVLETSVTQEEAAALHPGAAVTVTVPASGARTSTARISSVIAVVDPSTNRVPVEIEVPNPDGRLMANAYARAELPAAPPRDAWRIPAAALLQRDAGYSAWVAGADGTARALPVRLLGEDGASAVVVPADGSAWPAGLRAVETPPVGLAEGVAVGER